MALIALIEEVTTYWSSLPKDTQLYYCKYYQALFTLLKAVSQKVLHGNSERIDSKLNPIRYKCSISTDYFLLHLKAAAPSLKPFFDSLSSILNGMKMYPTGKFGLLTRKWFYQESNTLFKGINELNKFFASDFQPPITLEVLYSIWESEVLSHMAQSAVGCIVLWIDDKPLVDEATIQAVDFAAILSRTTSQIVKDRFDFLHFLGNDDKYEGRLRIIVNTEDPLSVLDALNVGPFKGKLLDILMNKELFSLELQDSLLALREDFILSAGTSGFLNFIKFSTLLWIGQMSDEGFELALRKNGVVLHVSNDFDEISAFLLVNKHLRRCCYFRVVIAAAGIKTDVSPLVSVIRNFNPAPILIKLNSIKDLDFNIHEFPFVHATTAEEEVERYCSQMIEPNWAKTNALFWNPSKKAHKNKMNGELVIHSVSCSNLYSTGKDQFIVMTVNAKKEKSKMTKDIIAPDWTDLNWTADISSSDTIKFEVFTNELLGTNFEGQIEVNLGAMVPLPVDQLQFTKVLRGHDANDIRKNRKIRGCMTVCLSFKYKIEENGKHFEKPLGDSLTNAMRDGVLHVTDKVIYNFLRFHLEDEGLFRLPGNATRVKALRSEIESGSDSNWDDELVHDVGSLYKMYFTALKDVVDTLLPATLYNDYKNIAKEPHDSAKVSKLIELIDKLPDPNYKVFVSLLGFLNTISKYSDTNKMTAQNLAVCFAPTIIIPSAISSDPAAVLYDSHLVTDLLALMIEQVDSIVPARLPSLVIPEAPESDFSELEFVTTVNPLTEGRRTLLNAKRSQFAKSRASSAPMIQTEGKPVGAKRSLNQQQPQPVAAATAPSPVDNKPKVTEKRKTMLRQSSLSVFGKKRPKSEKLDKVLIVADSKKPQDALPEEDEGEGEVTEAEVSEVEETKRMGHGMKTMASDPTLLELEVPLTPNSSMPLSYRQPSSSRKKAGGSVGPSRRRSTRKAMLVKIDTFKPEEENIYAINEGDDAKKTEEKH